LKRLIWFLSVAVALSLLSFSPLALAQQHVMTLASSLPQAPAANGDIMARTHLRILVPGNGNTSFGAAAVNPAELPPFPGFLFETPASMACVYKLVVLPIKGCNPNLTTANPTGGNHAIALVDAFDDATAESDLATFSAQFGLPAADFTVVFANGTRPGIDRTGGFEIEESLDIEWAHAMAPAAKIFLVEAANNSFTNLFNAAVVASNLVAAAGGGEVSMSFGAPEADLSAAFEAAADPTFTTPGIVYFASAGDSPGTEYPSASPNVVSAGGTSISRNTTTGDFFLESTWQDAGGGPSLFEPRPAFQNGIKHIVGNARGTPDFSFNANPTSGVWVFDTNPVLGTGWFVVGGTSVAAPSLSGIVNAAGGFRASSQAENQFIYDHMGNSGQFRDIDFGNCGLNVSNLAVDGWDFCTGVGTDQGLRGK
jgi:kumamolisin